VRHWAGRVAAVQVKNEERNRRSAGEKKFSAVLLSVWSVHIITLAENMPPVAGDTYIV
jgi:hypothetical protein